MLTTKELAAHMKVHHNTIQRWRDQGLPHYKLGTRTFRYDLNEVINWVEKEKERVK